MWLITGGGVQKGCSDNLYGDDEVEVGMVVSCST